MARKYQKPRGVFYRLNHNIRAKEVRVVDEKGNQIGVMPLGKAISLAREKDQDLVEVAPKARPPVCKVINFKKFKFNEAKKRQKEKKKTKKVDLKEIRLTPFIAENDLKFRLERGKEFLREGNRIKLNVFFRGREMAKKEFGYRLLEKALVQIGDLAKIEYEPKFVGRRLEILLSPNNSTEVKDSKQKENHSKAKSSKKETKTKNESKKAKDQ